jgi:hypothetical protein
MLAFFIGRSYSCTTMRKYQEFPDGFVERMTNREMAIVYERLDPDVHCLVDALLGYDGDNLTGRVTTYADGSELALRALKLNVGRALPRYDRGARGKMEQVGETRVIEPHDEFEIVGGPYTTHPYRGFFAVLHRAATIEQIDPHVRTRLSCNDFQGIPIVRV